MFKIGNDYVKSDIYRILNVPKESQRGAWDTGYRKYGDNIYIFANIGVAGRTGHDYDNHWEGEDFVWYGRTTSNIHQPLIKEILAPRSNVHIFTRQDDRDPFTYQGTGKIRRFFDTTPVKIIWKLNTSGIINPETAWQILLSNARHFLETREVYHSPRNGNEYKIIKVGPRGIVIRRLSIGSKSEETLTYNNFKTAFNKISADSNSIPISKLSKPVAFETTIVQLLPMLDWDDNSENIIIAEDEAYYETRGANFSEAKNDTDVKLLTRQLRIRRGQNKLRENLFLLYQGRCCITRFNIKEILHACHILPHSETGDNSSLNAILLRSDIHDLFDANLIGVNPSTMKVKVKKSLFVTEYSQLEGVEILERKDRKTPSIDALTHRWNIFRRS